MSLPMSYPAFPKIPRLNTNFILTEKIDGTNGLILVSQNDSHELLGNMPPPLEVVDDLYIWAGSRKRWIVPSSDNFGFAAWVQENADTLVRLGPGRHYGEWYGQGIQRKYGLDHRRFMLFDTLRWRDDDGALLLPEGLPDNVELSTVLSEVPGQYLNIEVEICASVMRSMGSYHVPGWDNPEGIVIFNKLNRSLFKVVLDKADSINVNDFPLPVLEAANA